MKALNLFAIGAVLLVLDGAFPAQGQAYSPRRLTRRAAPQIAPAAPAAPAAPVAPAAPLPTPQGAYVPPAPLAVAAPPIDPEKIRAEREEGARNALEFRKQRADEEAAAAKASPLAARAKPPLDIGCDKIVPDSNDLLQSLTLSVTNRVPHDVTRVTMCLKYFDAKGRNLKEWTTFRQLEQPMPGMSTTELDQPAYFMPLVTKRVEVVVKEVRFADGTKWPSTPTGTE